MSQLAMSSPEGLSLGNGPCPDDPRLFDLSDPTTARVFEVLTAITDRYSSVHPVLCALLCPLGIFINTIHILVLTTVKMRRSAVNRILIGVALCDIATMASYLVYIVRFVLARALIDNPSVVGFSYNWALFLRVHATLSIALHSTTLYLCVSMAFIRWRAMHDHHSVFLRPQFTGYLCAATFFIVSVVCSPTFIVHDVKEIEGGGYTVDFSVFATASECRVLKANLWLIGILLKVTPCVFLTFFTSLLMALLQKTQARRALLLMHSKSSSIRRRNRLYDRTTLTLVVMLTIFILTELPQGVVSVLNGVFTHDVYSLIYVRFGDLLDLLSLINCYVSFAAYGFVCSKYRQTFLMLMIRTTEKMSSKLETTFGEGASSSTLAALRSLAAEGHASTREKILSLKRRRSGGRRSAGGRQPSEKEQQRQRHRNEIRDCLVTCKTGQSATTVIVAEEEDRMECTESLLPDHSPRTASILSPFKEFQTATR